MSEEKREDQEPVREPVEEEPQEEEEEQPRDPEIHTAPEEPAEEPAAAPANSSISMNSVLKILDDWESDYFTPISFPTHTRDHLYHALGQLKDRIRGLGH